MIYYYQLYTKTKDKINSINNPTAFYNRHLYLLDLVLIVNKLNNRKPHTTNAFSSITAQSLIYKVVFVLFNS